MEIEPRQSSATPDAATGQSRRSGRVVRAPTKYAPESNVASAKRHRAQDPDGGEDENQSPEDDEDEDAMSDDDQDAEDEDEAAPIKRKGKKRAASQSAGGKKPAAKKPKINGSAAGGTEQLTSLARRPKKTVRIDVGDREGDLYGKICNAD
jgi:cohesin complex subunit SA-1/2